MITFYDRLTMTWSRERASERRLDVVRAVAPEGVLHSHGRTRRHGARHSVSLRALCTRFAIGVFFTFFAIITMGLEESDSGLGLRAASAQSSKPVAACIRSWGEARYGALGYNHIVHIADGCDAPADCVVSTNVNPEPQSVTVPPHAEIQVTTFLGSPARTFVPHVTCTMRAP